MARTARWAAAALALWAGAAAAASDDSREEALKSRLDKVDQALEAWDVASAQAALSAVDPKGDSDDEAVLYFRGRIAFERGEYPRAIDLLQKAGVGDRPGSYLHLAKETQGVVEKHLRLESPHFIFFYPPGKDEVLAPYALETLEAQRAALLQDLGHAPAGKVRVEVVNDARELAKVSTLTLAQIRTTGTIAICKFDKLMVTSPKAVLKGYDWQDTLAHEYTHLVVSQKSKNTVPIWLHEGMAKYLESRWRGQAGLAMSPSTLALLGARVKKDRLIPFEKMHPSIALLPTAEDAATAFAEVFYAVDLIFKEQGTRGLQTIIEQLAQGKTDRRAVEAATSRSFDAFEKAWLAHVKKQQFPRELIPMSDVKVVLREDAPGKKKDDKKREIGFGDFKEVEEEEGRKAAHLGEVLREKGRIAAAAEEYGRAYRVVGDRYESVSNKYALALLELRRTEEAERVLEGSLRVHPGSPSTNVHLGRIYLWRQEWSKARAAYLDALSADPFDEEIHFALLRANAQMGNAALADRARKAAQKLTGLTAEAVDRVSQQLTRPAPGPAVTGPVTGAAAGDGGSPERN
ncbi:MAG TPA: tetratricopeptide repeat protein [Myxococcales bacterium]|nr:tetratricopeptide repeat protein [Myxococcales bacterium]